MTSEDKKHFTLIDLFSGAGDMTLGFTEASGNAFKPVWANDSDKKGDAQFTTLGGTNRKMDTNKRLFHRASKQ